jgi:hypothetical protein
VTYPSIGNFTWRKKKYTIHGRKCKNKPSEPKNGIWAQNQHGRVIYSSIGNFTCSKKRNTLAGKRRK